MLDKLKNMIKESAEMMGPPDLAQFNDPVAQKTEWTPLKSGGSNFGTHKLVEVDHNRVKFQSTIGAKLFSIIFIAVGIAAPALILSNTLFGSEPLDWSGVLFALLFGGAFGGIGGYMFYSYSKPVVFDKLNGYYWKGWNEPDSTMHTEYSETSARLRDVHAIQIIREYIRSDKKSYYSYEINLIKKDGTRLNVIDHGSKMKVLRDAKKLAEFTGKPLWDGTGFTH